MESNGLFKKIYLTRDPDFGFVKIEPGLWRFIYFGYSRDGKREILGTDCVGPRYHSKAELLADFENYIQIWE